MMSKYLKITNFFLNCHNFPDSFVILGMKFRVWICLLIFSPLIARTNELSLAEFISQVEKQNLDLKAEEARTQAADSRSIGWNLPPPMLGYIQINERTGGEVSGFEVSQSLPFPSRLLHDSSARKLEAQAQKASQNALIMETRSRARLLYFSLWAAQERLELLKEKKRIISQHIKLARVGARSDSFAKIHILKSESDVDLLENEILIAEQELRNFQIEASEIINQTAADFRPKVSEPPLQELPTAEDLRLPHQLESSRLNLASLQAREREVQASWFPDLNLRYKEMGASSMAPRYNEWMVGISLPFAYFWEPRASSQSARAEKLQAENQYQSTKRKIEAEQATLRIKAQSLRRQIMNLKEKLLPRAEKRMRLAHNLVPRDMETLQDHRETMEAFPNLKLTALEYRIQYEQALAELLKYMNKRDSHE